MPRLRIRVPEPRSALVFERCSSANREGSACHHEGMVLEALHTLKPLNPIKLLQRLVPEALCLKPETVNQPNAYVRNLLAKLLSRENKS